jgi:tetratricopeptide (TPR) repeat protein
MPLKPSFLSPDLLLSSLDRRSISPAFRRMRRGGWLAALLTAGTVCAETPAAPASAAAMDTPPQVVFEVVLAEIALKRDKPQVALAAYADLALKYNDPEIFRRTMEIAAINRQPDLMLEAGRLWVQKEPDSLEALNLLSSTQILLGRYSDAQPILQRYFALLPEDRRGPEFLRLNQRFPAQADPQRAQQLVDTVTAPYLSMPEAQLARAQSAMRAGNDAAAMEAVGNVRRLQPASEPGILLYAQLVGKRSPAAALDAYTEYLTHYPDAAPIRALYAQQLLVTGKLAETRAQARILVEQPNINPEPLFAAAAIAVQAQDPALAVRALQRLLTIDSVDTSLIEYNLGLAYESGAELARERKDSAALTAQESDAILHYLKVLPGEYYVPARLRAANLLARQGDMKAAQALLQTTPARNTSTRVELILGQATLLRDSGDVTGAFQLIEQAQKQYPASVPLRYEYGMLAERAGKMALFEKTMRDVIRKDPNFAQAYNALGFTFADKNIRLKEARGLLEKALSLSPNDPFILDSMGWLCYREKNFGVALDYLNRAASLRADPEIILHQVTVLKAMGRVEEAGRVWRAGLQQFPDNDALRSGGQALGLDSVAPIVPGRSL